MKLARLFVSIFLLLVLCSCAGIRKAPEVEHLDEVLLQKMLVLRPQPDGALTLTPTFSPYLINRDGVFIPGDDPIARYNKRGFNFFEAHLSLMSEEWFQSLMRETKDKVVLEVLPISAERSYCQPEIYNRLHPRVIRALLDAVGPPNISWAELPLEDAKIEEQFSAGDSCISGSVYTATDLPDAAAPFHCCSGRLVMTKLGGKYDTLLNDHFRLMNSDREYRGDFTSIRRPLDTRAGQLTRPLSLEEVRTCDQLTNKWRQTLAAPINGRPSILDRLQNSADTSVSVESSNGAVASSRAQ